MPVTNKKTFILRDDIAKLRSEVEDTTQRLKIKELQLQKAERDCRHEWGPVTPDHIYHPGYMSPGDPPGTMGVDRQLPCSIPARTEYRWKRVCQVCGKVEYTSRTEDKVEKVPKF